MQVNPVADIHQSSCFCLAFDPVKHKEKKNHILISPGKTWHILLKTIGHLF